MEDWSTEIIRILLGAILGLLFAEGLAAFKLWYKDRSLSSRERKIKAIMDEFSIVGTYADYPEFLVRSVLQTLVVGLLQLTSLVLVIGFYNLVTYVYSPSPIVRAYLVFMFILIIGFMGSNLVRILRRELGRLSGMNYVPGYVERSIKKLRKLGAIQEIAELEERVKRFDRG